jgi:sugar-specific transcriptional regulator TrmB
MIPKKDVEILTSLGLSTLQAKVYLATCILEEADVQKISASIQVARQQIYPAVKELEEIGLIEKILDKSLKLTNIPITDAVYLLLKRKYQEKAEAEKKAIDLTKRYEHKTKTKTMKAERENTFRLIPEKQALALRLKRSVDSAQKSIDIMLPKKTCLQAFFNLATNFLNALERGVKIRCIVDEQIVLNPLPSAIRKIVENNNFKLKVTSVPCMKSFGIYDKDTVIIGSRPRQNYARTSALWTNTTPLVSIVQQHFDTIWNETKPAEVTLNEIIFSQKKKCGL